MVRVSTPVIDPFFKDGLWDVMFEAPLRAPADDRVGLAIVSIKHELVYNGIPVGGMNLDVPEIGAGTERAIKTFQSRNGLTVDGSVGPKTATVLWRKRAKAEAVRIGAPPMLLAQQKSLESADDPACESAKKGSDPKLRDRGLVQSNQFYHEATLPEKDAFNAAIAMHWQADYMRSAYDGVLTAAGKKDWDLALAAYNVGWSAARTWDRAGRPAKNADDKPNTAYEYVRVVKTRTG